MQNQKGSLIILIMAGILITVIAGSAYYLGTQNSPKIDSPVIAQNLESEANANIFVKIEAGNLVVTKDGETKKITDWGYNSSPVLSPNKSKIAYLSKTEESFENAKKFTTYVPDSTNIWIINIDGSKPIKVTAHNDWIYRDNLIWLDNNRLLFTDGTSSVKVYNLTNKTLENILGPEAPSGVCLDACGAETRFLLSPDKKYLVHLTAKGIGGIAPIYENKILNLETLITEQMNQNFSTLDFGGAEFKDDSLFIEGTENPDEIPTTFNVNLKTGEASHL